MARIEQARTEQYFSCGARAGFAWRAHSTPDPEQPPPDHVPVPDEEPEPEQAPVREPMPPQAPIKTGPALRGAAPGAAGRRARIRAAA